MNEDEEDCPHTAVEIDNFHPQGAFVICITCKGNLFISLNDIEERLPFTFTSPKGKEHDITLLVDERIFPRVFGIAILM